MSKPSGRWILVTHDLPVRSKSQRHAAISFARWLIEIGYTPIHRTASIRYVPTITAIRTEFARIDRAVPSRGTVTVMELANAAHSRSLRYVDGQLHSPPAPPPLLTVYGDPDGSNSL
ncbi:MAG: hypothetical protein FWD29_08145 [Micrococcales bacterium]|nr:hypothetical protein [Micrococcales bacterium]